MDNPTTLLVAIMYVTIISIGLSNLLMALSDLVGGRLKVKPDRVHTSWLLLLLFAYFNYFWQTTAILEIDVTLARGLNYYTGAIFEVSPPSEVNMGSIGGGGRYDDLTGIFGLKDVSGVGISFGLDRIYLVLEEMNLFPETITETTKVLFINFGEMEAAYAMKAITKLRKAGISAELYPDAAKNQKQLGKQMNYVNNRAIQYAVLAGENEINTGKFTLKNMKSGEQLSFDFHGLLEFLL